MTRKVTVDITRDRLAETEYVSLADPSYVTETKFGHFYHHPEYPTRHDANQLMRCVCPAGSFDALLGELARLYEPTDVNYRKVSGHDPQTFEIASEGFAPLGVEGMTTWMMVHERASKRPTNPEIVVRVLTPERLHDLESLHKNQNGEPTAAFRFYRAQDARIGGEVLLAYLDDRPIASSGFFIVDGIARFRGVGTVKWARGRGAASAIIHYVQNHPDVRAADALTIFCDDEGPIPLYERLGFVKRHLFWAFGYEPA